MSTKLITIRESDSLQMVKDLFLADRIHHLPVVDQYGMLKGIMTTYDMFKLGLDQSDYRNHLVKDHMTSSVARLQPTESIGVAAEIFLENLFHALPIVDESGRLVGLVTTFDVLKYEFKKEYPSQFE